MTKPTDADGGIPSSSFSQTPAAASAAMAAGDVTALCAFWSQPAARMSAAVAAGNAPPMTNPKYRGPALATRPGAAAASRSASTCSGGEGAEGNGPENASTNAPWSIDTPTGRSGNDRR
ncbi:MAG: hypothetical protein JWP48_1448 [Actinoallomurus sp.]|nr:hypothetical protein [Actinoallomurus sp.]